MSTKLTQPSVVREIRQIEISRIVPDRDQPRKRFDRESLNRLASTYAKKGLLNPIRVRPEGNGFKIICGERRYCAAKLAKHQVIDCIVVDTPLTRQEILEEQLIDDTHREDLDPIDAANAYRELMSLRSCNQQQLAEHLGISKSSMTASLALLTLPKSVQLKVQSGSLGAMTAYHLSKLPDPTQQEEMAELAVTKKLSRKRCIRIIRETTGIAQQVLPEVPSAMGQPAQPHDCVQLVARHDARRLDTLVTVRSKQKLSAPELVAVLQAALEKAQKIQTLLFDFT